MFQLPKTKTQLRYEAARLRNSELEREVEKLKAENYKLLQAREHQEHLLDGLRPQVQYLRGFVWELKQKWWFKFFGKKLAKEYAEHIVKP